MTLPSPDMGIVGGGIRFCEGIVSATPTLLVGLLIAAILRYYYGPQGTRTLFGGESFRSLPQSWAIGMLLPVCSIGVIPILIEMRRAKVKPGALSAFALSAPLFNPLSLLYGLTLSRPLVVLMFGFASLLVVTLLGVIWDRLAERKSKSSLEPDTNDGATIPSPNDPSASLIGVQRLFAVMVHMTRSLTGSVGGWGLVGLSGLFLLSMVLPYGGMQHSVERDDWMAPATMTAVALPAYATPMLAMSQLGMMFQHANSPGAAFVLLVLGTGVNLATIGWLAWNFGLRSVCLWFFTLLAIVVGLAYSINKPLVPPGVQPAGHTHAFDIYTNPIPTKDSLRLSFVREKLVDDLDLAEKIVLGSLAFFVVIGLGVRLVGWDENKIIQKATEVQAGATAAEALPKYDLIVSPKIVGGVMLLGLVVLSVVMCYAYYPGPNEALAEIAAARAECLTAANSGQVEHAAYWLQNWDDWSRRLEVGVFLRTGRLTPYQRMQGYLIRKKLEALEHELEHDPFELEETRKVVTDILGTNRRWVDSFRPPKKD